MTRTKEQKSSSEISEDDFELLLAWLDSDRQRAALKYEKIRSRLIKIFVSRGSAEAEDLTDKTIDRVASKVKSLKENYTGNPALYFYGVAKKVFLESLRSNQRKRAAFEATPMNRTADDIARVSEEDEEDEHRANCMRECLEKLPSEQRALIEEYYSGAIDENASKIKRRSGMAERSGVALATFRIRIHRIKKSLQNCLDKCLDKNH